MKRTRTLLMMILISLIIAGIGLAPAEQAQAASHNHIDTQRLTNRDHDNQAPKIFKVKRRGPGHTAAIAIHRQAAPLEAQKASTKPATWGAYLFGLVLGGWLLLARTRRRWH